MYIIMLLTYHHRFYQNKLGKSVFRKQLVYEMNYSVQKLACSMHLFIPFMQMCITIMFMRSFSLLFIDLILAR